MTLRRGHTAWITTAWRVLFCLALVGLPVGCGERSPAPVGRKDKPAADTTAHYDEAATSQPQPAAPLAAVAPAPKPTQTLPEGVSCVTPACHAAFATSRTIHAPVGSGDCTVCHQPDEGGHKYPLKRGTIETCTFCHKVTDTRAVQHRATQTPGCLGCHNPHASNTKFLLTEISVEQLCAHCHQVPLKKYAHDPFARGECTVCHQPHEADNKFLLRGGAGPEHCFTCHADTKRLLVNSPAIHKPAAQDCVTCHSPHATDYPRQLKQPVQATCLSCHKNLEKSLAGVQFPHQAVFVEQSCANCHDAHASDRAKLLRDREDHLCLTCHDKEIKATDGHMIPNMKFTLTASQYLHGPVKSGDCTACHNAHGAAQADLLRQTFPASFYTSFDLTSYALCFTCHDKALVLTPRTANLTGFRDGDVNLHYLHVNRPDKGRTCRSCHAIHGSDLPKHMASTVPFDGSRWAMPIQFEKTADGGQCTPGCHEAHSYNRVKPVPATQPATHPATRPATQPR